MNDATQLRELSSAIELALAVQDLPLAHRLLDERLLLLQSICAIGQFDAELILAAQSALALDEKLCSALDSEKNILQQRLHDVITANKATRLYRAHAK
ncbi:hypothetical protein [Aeromonas salmonicida]|uniref:hypothetical protein n=1 Tax=Aeromonas salmonicida TaxID=645 RepID=UPI003CFD8E2C